MRKLSCGVAVALSLSTMAVAQERLHGYVTVIPATRSVPVPEGVRTVAPALPTWNYSVVASADRGGGTYTGTIIGGNPHAATKTSVTIKTQIVPLVITINDGSTTVVYDPTKADPCAGGKAETALVQASPIFTNTVWKMNGVSVGTTQYIDAFQRAEFWSLVKNTNYHVLLSPTVLAAQKMTFKGATAGSNFDAAANGGCGHVGVVGINDIGNRIQALITGPLKALINTGTFPIFITKDVVSATSGVSIYANCCVLGYHSGFYVGNQLQIFSPFAYDSSGVFGPDVSDVTTLSHEMGEAINDPTGGNPTPEWGGIGQVQNSCQNNFEVGDPLSEGWGTPTKPFVVKASNGATYHMQELAFFNWYYGGKSLGAGLKYSDNSTFAGDAKACPSGGTN
jgi:hypothetical protein